MKRILFLLGLFAVGCGVKAPRGSFEIVSTRPVDDKFVALSSAIVEGKACFGAATAVTGLPMSDQVFERSLADAISKYQGATYLLNLSVVDQGYCVLTRGIPAVAK